MEKAFLFIKTRVRVEPPAKSKLARTVEAISKQVVVIKTLERVGAGVKIGDKIITALSLVQNDTMFTIISGESLRRGQAVVVGRDDKNQLAKLKEIELNCPTHRKCDLLKFNRLKPRAIGEALLTVDVRTQVPKVEVATMLYSTRVSGREETQNRLKIDHNRPRGCLGAGVWDIDGDLAGITIGRMIPPKGEFLQQAMAAVHQNLGFAQVGEKFEDLQQSLATRPRVYAVPVDRMLDLVETN